MFFTNIILHSPAIIAIVYGIALLAPPAQGDESQIRDAGKVTLLRTPNKGIQPQAIIDSKGIVHLIDFIGEPANGDIFYLHSEDNGTHFSQPLRINSQAGSAIAIGNIRGAHLAIGRAGRIHVAWMGSGKAKGLAEATPMLYTRLNGDGSGFEPQRNLIQSAVGLDGGGSVCADDAGNVCVAWHAPEPGSKGEANRRVWLAHSTDDGKTFSAEKAVSDKGTGVCGCCGMRAMSDAKGNLFMLYRSATQELNRDTYLLSSNDQGKTFASNRIEPWNINACPMSSFALAEAKEGILAAWETDGQVSFTRIDPKTGNRSDPVAAPGAGKGRKHPAVAGNARGETILVWTEGIGWNRGGSVAWQVYDKNGKPTTEHGRANGVPVWSLVTVFARADGGFTIVY